MLVQFTLGMPANNAWNGKWSGERNLYAVVKSVSKRYLAKSSPTILEQGYFTYSFGDGWVAGISVKEITAQEARRVQKASAGFCGYEWMVRSILTYGEIHAPGGR